MKLEHHQREEMCPCKKNKIFYADMFNHAMKNKEPQIIHFNNIKSEGLRDILYANFLPSNKHLSFACGITELEI